MMTQRRVVVLMAAAVVVVAGAVWVSSQRHLDRDITAGQPVLEGLKAALNEVTEIRVTKGDGTHATLRKRPTDWAVVERDYPADSGKVRKLLLDLGALEVVEEKTRDPANFARIGVDEVNSAKATGTRVEAVTPKKVYGLIVGNTSGSKSVYVRATGAPQSLLASPQVTADSDPKRWLDHTLVDIPEARIKEIALAPAGSPAYTVNREKKEQTDFTVSSVPKGRELSSPTAGNPLAGNLASVTLDDVRSAATAAAATDPVDHATFRTFDGLQLQVDGHKEGEHHYVSFTPTSTAKETEAEAKTLATRVKGWQFEIPNYKYDALFRPLEDLLKKPEAKETKATGAKPSKKAPAAAPPPTS